MPPKRLTAKKYVSILKKYNKRSTTKPTTKKLLPVAQLKAATKRLLSDKFCRCIKKIKGKSASRGAEQRAIAICTKSIFNNNGVHRGKFTCVGGPRTLEIS